MDASEEGSVSFDEKETKNANLHTEMLAKV